MKTKSKPETQAAQIKELKAWKRSALRILNSLDEQAIGKELNIELGASIAPAILPNIKGLKAEIARLHIQLSEARRRTIPMSGSNHDVNFLPVCITEVRVDRDTKTIFDARRMPLLVASGKPKFILTVLADSVEGAVFNEYQVRD